MNKLRLFDELQTRYRDPLSLVESCRCIRPTGLTPSLKQAYAEDERLQSGMDEVLGRGIKTDLRELGLIEPAVSRERSS